MSLGKEGILQTLERTTSGLSTSSLIVKYASSSTGDPPTSPQLDVS